jgi:biopolymer transport protein ExbD
MIDIVFQLLVFFIMSFKIAAPEGDFDIHMPLAAPSQGLPDDLQFPPLKLRMTADDQGELAAMALNDQPLEGFAALQERIIGLVGFDAGPIDMAAAAEVELDCDPQLKYRFVIQAISSLSGYITPDRRTVRLIEKIKFAPPRQPSGG